MPIRLRGIQPAIRGCKGLDRGETLGSVVSQFKVTVLTSISASQRCPYDTSAKDECQSGAPADTCVRSGIDNRFNHFRFSWYGPLCEAVVAGHRVDLTRLPFILKTCSSMTI